MSITQLTSMTSLTSIATASPLMCIALLAAALVLAGCHASQGPTNPSSNPSGDADVIAIPLRGTTWQLTELLGEVPVRSDDPRGPQLQIDPVESRYSGYATVNSIFGPAEVDGVALRLKPGGMTKKAGPKELMQQEGKFVAMLDLVRSFRIESSTLILLDGQGSTVARFSAQKP